MNPALPVAVLVFATMLLLALPLIPAIMELYRKSDAVPLSVVQRHAGDIRYFATGFRNYLTPIEGELKRSETTRVGSEGILADGTKYCVIGSPSQPVPVQGNVCPVLIATAWNLRAASGIAFQKDIYTRRGFIGGENNSYRAILADSSIQLGNSSCVTRWLHASGEVRTGADCRLEGRVSSDQALLLERGTRFLRLNAPLIATSRLENVEWMTANQPGRNESLLTTVRELHHGDLKIEPGEVVRANLVVRGNLQIGAGAQIHASVKSCRDLMLERDVYIAGSAISGRTMEIGQNSSIAGPVIAERSIFIHDGTRCGTPEKPTTVSAPRITVQERVLICGTLWARESGQVVSRQ